MPRTETVVTLGIKEQKYKIESYSQRLYTLFTNLTRWESKNKNTKLKAIHNYRTYATLFHCVGNQRTKIQNWKLFTTYIWDWWERYKLGIKEQKYKIESYSQLRWYSRKIFTSWESKNKNTKLKAIHNFEGYCHETVDVGNQRTKIQNWKLFTTKLFEQTGLTRWESKNKNTKLKAIHNVLRDVHTEWIVGNQRTKIQNWKLFTTNFW